MATYKTYYKLRNSANDAWDTYYFYTTAAVVSETSARKFVPWSGTAGYVLKAGSSGPEWTAQSNLSVGSATNATYLGTSTEGYSKSSLDTALSGKIAKSLLTTAGDIIYASAASTPARLGIGTNGYFLTVSSGVPAWAAISKTTVGLGNVENTALSTWAGSSNLTTCNQGTFGTAAVATKETSTTASTLKSSSNLVTGSQVKTIVESYGYSTTTGTVTGSSLTSGNIIVGGGGTAISASSYTIQNLVDIATGRVAARVITRADITNTTVRDKICVAIGTSISDVTLTLTELNDLGYGAMSAWEIGFVLFVKETGYHDWWVSAKDTTNSTVTFSPLEAMNVNLSDYVTKATGVTGVSYSSGKIQKTINGSTTDVVTVKIDNGVITIGSNSITPLTSHQDISGKQNKVGALGSTTKPVYTSAAGTFAECSTYAGGTAVTLNGTSKAASTASFYAPTSLGTAGQVLATNSGATAVEWKSLGGASAKGVVTTMTGNTTSTDLITAAAVYDYVSAAVTATHKVTAASSAPSSPNAGDIWLDTSGGTV